MVFTHYVYVTGEGDDHEADASEGDRFSDDDDVERYKAHSVDGCRSDVFPDDGDHASILIKEEALDEEETKVMVMEEPEIEFMESPTNHNFDLYHHTYPDNLPSYKSPNLMNSDSDTCDEGQKLYRHRSQCQRRDKGIKLSKGKDGETFFVCNFGKSWTEGFRVVSKLPCPLPSSTWVCRGRKTFAGCFMNFSIILASQASCSLSSINKNLWFQTCAGKNGLQIAYPCIASN